MLWCPSKGPALGGGAFHALSTVVLVLRTSDYMTQNSNMVNSSEMLCGCVHGDGEMSIIKKKKDNKKTADLLVSVASNMTYDSDGSHG